MTVPGEYWSASRDFEAYLADLKSISMLATHNQCYHMTRAVLGDRVDFDPTGTPQD